MIFQKVAIADDPTPNDRIDPCFAHQFTADADLQVRRNPLLFCHLIRQRFPSHACVHGQIIHQILFFPLQAEIIVGESGKGFQSNADMCFQRFAVRVDIQALLIGNPDSELPWRFVVAGEHL